MKFYLPKRLPRPTTLAATAGVVAALLCPNPRSMVTNPVAAQESPTQTVASTVPSSDKKPAEEPYVKPSDSELRARLSPIQYKVTQREDTEPAFRNKYWDNKKSGQYACVVCDQPLFTSETKYKSGTGWPSFFAPVEPEAVGTRSDWRLFYSRTEVHCSRCEAHLGHVFDDGPQPTGKRYCMNSASLEFKPAEAE